METTEKPEHFQGGYYYFQGVTINNLVINGDMAKSCSDQFMNAPTPQCIVNGDVLVKALQQCQEYIWGNAAYSIGFCVCRDIYHLENNATQYERILNERGIPLPPGTVNTTISRNPWMKYHVDKWECNGASERAMRLRDVLKERMETLLGAKITA